MKISTTTLAFLTVFGSSFACAGTQEEQTTTLADQTGLSLTIYNDDLALIRDQRNLRLAKGESRLAIRDVSGRMRPETALLRSVNRPGAIHIREQNFNFDLLTPQKMLDKYVGKDVYISTINPASGKKSTRKATILSTNSGVVARIDGQVETNPQGNWIFPSIPANLRDKPTLITTLNNSASGQQTLELSYLSGGLSWKADYVAKLGQDDKTLSLAGWVTLTNKSGTSYPNARLQLVAGDVNQVQPEPRYYKERVYAAAAPMPEPAMNQESLFEYHLYSLPRPTSIADNQTKQIALLNAAEVKADKQLILEGQSYYYQNNIRLREEKLKIGVHLKFVNDKANHLGQPLPKGVIRVYKEDSNGQAQFIGEDRIDHTANKETLDLTLGDSFDVSATRIQTAFVKRNFGHPYKFAAESAYRITLKNGKKSPVTVTVNEPIPHDWEITQESHRHKKISANRVQWQIDIAPESTTILEYSALVRY